MPEFEKPWERDDQIRDIPDDFRPEMDKSLDRVVGRVHLTGAGGALEVELAFLRTGDDAKDDRMAGHLRAALWQASELYRLGRYEEARRFAGQ